MFMVMDIKNFVNIAGCTSIKMPGTWEDTPECQEGVPSHSRCTARGRTWGSPLIVSGPVGNPELYPEHKRSPKSINDI